MPTVLTTSTQHADLKHCDSLAFFTTQHLRPSDHHTKALSTRATRCRGGLLQGRYAGCSRPFRAGLTLHKLFVHALHVQGRPHRTLGAAAAFWHATMRGQARVAAVHHGPRPCGLTGQQAGQASAAQAVGARAWTGPSGPRGALRRPASGHMRPCERAAATPEAERWRTAAKWADDRCSFALCLPSVHAFA